MPGESGHVTFIWDLKNRDGCRVASGVYFCVAESKSFRNGMKIVVR